MIFLNIQDCNFKAIKHIHTEAVKGLSHFYTPEQLDAWTSGTAENLSHALKTADLFAYLKHNTQEIGFMSLKQGVLWHLYIHPEFQKNGYGLKLLQYAEEWAANHALPSLKLKANKSAVGFYKKQGYAPTKTDFIKIKDISIEVVEMEKKLKQ